MSEGVVMFGTRTIRSTPVVVIGAVVAALATALPASDIARASDEAECEFTGNLVETLVVNDPLVLGPRGQIITYESDPGAVGGLWLHREWSGGVPIEFSHGGSPSGPEDINGRGVSVGTSNVNQGTAGAGVPWIARGARASLLPTPGASSTSYFAHSVNGSKVVAGVATTYPFVDTSSPNFVSVPLVWSSPTDQPIELKVPSRSLDVALSRGRPLIDTQNSGSVTAVMTDGTNMYLVVWEEPGAVPTTHELPVDFRPSDLAGRQVIGFLGLAVLVYSPDSRLLIQRTTPGYSFVRAMISVGGTYAFTAESAGPLRGYVGRGLSAVRDVTSLGLPVDVDSHRDGMLAMDIAPYTQRVTCALGAPESTDFTVTPFPAP